MTPFWKNILDALAVGLTLVFLIGFSKIFRHWRRPELFPKETQNNFSKSIRRLGALFSQAIYILLGISLVWIGYFAIIGIADPAKTEYAANSATLLVSVATIFSIMIAFYEFSHSRNIPPKENTSIEETKNEE